MNEHDDDIEPEVEEGTEFEVEEFPILEEDDENEDAERESDETDAEQDTDPDAAEI